MNPQNPGEAPEDRRNLAVITSDNYPDTGGQIMTKQAIGEVVL
jgi:hypothetical protein